jgi:predicted nucleotidyltransferase
MKLRVYNKTLDPLIWNENKTIKPEIRDHLLKIAEDFYNSTDLTGDIHDILFLGSSANYNWTPTSDMDLHVVIDIAEEKINEEYARKFMESLSYKWNSEHDIEIKGHPVEIYLQDLREPNSDATKGRPGAAIYSLFDGKWIIEPKHEVPNVDADKVRQKYKVIQNKVKNLVDTRDITKLKELMKSIRNYRNAGLASGGEFSVENLVFKALRKGGDLGRIKDTINTVYDQYASLPENGNVQPEKKTTPMNLLMKANFMWV